MSKATVFYVDGRELSVGSVGVDADVLADDERACSLHVELTHEGIIADLWRYSKSAPEHLGTFAVMYQDYAPGIRPRSA